MEIINPRFHFRDSQGKDPLETAIEMVSSKNHATYGKVKQVLENIQIFYVIKQPKDSIIIMDSDFCILMEIINKVLIQKSIFIELKSYFQKMESKEMINMPKLKLTYPSLLAGCVETLEVETLELVADDKIVVAFPPFVKFPDGVPLHPGAPPSKTMFEKTNGCPNGLGSTKVQSFKCKKSYTP